MMSDHLQPYAAEFEQLLKSASSLSRAVTMARSNPALTQCMFGRGWSPLHLVLSLRPNPQVDAAFFDLVQLGADPALVLSSGESLLHIAASRGHINIAEWLVANGKVDPWLQLQPSGKVAFELCHNSEHQQALMRASMQRLWPTVPPFAIEKFMGARKDLFEGKFRQARNAFQSLGLQAYDLSAVYRVVAVLKSGFPLTDVQEELKRLKARHVAEDPLFGFCCWASVFFLCTEGKFTEARRNVSLFRDSLHSRQLEVLIDEVRFADDYLSEAESSAVQSTAQSASGDAVATAANKSVVPEKLRQQFPSFEQLDKLVGLTEVKKMLVDLYHNLQVSVRSGLKSELLLNSLFVGNPGTGKTTVARIFGKALTEIGVVKSTMFLERSAGDLATAKGSSDFQKDLDNIKKAGGGVIFIDEAYLLKPSVNSFGRDVLNQVLTVAENDRDTTVFILAGYEEDIEKELVSANRGLPSRFPLKFKFADYTFEELRTLLVSGTKERGLSFESADIADVAARRLRRRAGVRGFANAREVRDVILSSKNRAFARLVESVDADVDRIPVEAARTLQRNDVLGMRRMNWNNPHWKAIDSMIGLENAKRFVKSVISLVENNREREEKGEDVDVIPLNLTILGNPGTGKTTFARHYARLLADLGLLSKGDFLEKTVKDFVGQYIGESEQKTAAIMEAARGNVVFVDEAYQFASSSDLNSFNKAAIDTMVGMISPEPGADMCVIFAGYKEDMEQFYRTSNVGLARRLRAAHPLIMEDFSDSELEEVLMQTAKKERFAISESVCNLAIQKLASERSLKNFGNAGAVKDLLARGAMAFTARNVGGSCTRELTAADLGVDLDERRHQVRKLLDSFAATPNVLQELQLLAFRVREMEKFGRSPMDLATNYLFIGNPGCGKTTVARYLPKLLHALGIIGTDKLVEKSAGDMVGQYIGQTGSKTRSIIDSARGGVLFIDEAYDLLPRHGSFNNEVINELVKSLSSPEVKGNMVVILAGYEREMMQLMSANPGLKSRFPIEWTFDDWTVEQCVQTVCNNYDSSEIWKMFRLSDDARALLPDELCRLMRAPRWANGRDIENFLHAVDRARAIRCMRGGSMDGDNDESVITGDDIRSAIQCMVSEKYATSRSTEPSVAVPTIAAVNATFEPGFAVAMDVDDQYLSNSAHAVTHAKQNMKDSEQEECQCEDDGDDEGRDTGVSDEIWRQIQRAKADEKAMRLMLAEREQEIQRLRQEAQARAEEAAREQRRLDDLLRQAVEDEERLRIEARRRAAEQEQLREQEEIDKKLRELIRQQEEALERQRREAAIQARLRAMGVCPVGYRWLPIGGGYVCAGGSHFISNASLGLS